MLPLPLIFQVDTSTPTSDHWTLLLLFEAHILFPDFPGKFEKMAILYDYSLVKSLLN